MPSKREHVAALAAHAVAVGDVELLLARAVQEQVAVLCGQILPRRCKVDLVALGDGLDDLLVEARVDDRPRHQRALRDGERGIGHHQLGVDLALHAEARAPRACAVRRVEREDARRELGQRDAVLGAARTSRSRSGSAPSTSLISTSPSASRRAVSTESVRRGAQPGLHHQAVDDDRDGVADLLVELDRAPRASAARHRP